MAYKLNDLKIIPATLDLLTPSDGGGLTGEECLDLTDCWAGADGKLEQAPQPALVASTPPIDSLCIASGRTYYGGGGILGQVGRGTIDSGYDSNELGLISYQGYCWVMNQAQQRKDDGSATTDWTIAAPTSAPTLADLGTGGQGAKQHLYEDNYRITWVIANLGETNPSPSVLLTPAVDDSTTRITRPSAPAGVTGWNVYRQVPAFGGASLDADTAPYLLNPDPIPIATTTYDDTGNSILNQDETSLLRLGAILEENHDPAPAARVVANNTYNGRIVVGNSSSHRNRIWFTKPLQPAFFRGSANDFGGDWVDVGTDEGDAILAMTVRPTMLVIYRQKSIWIHLGDMGASDALLQPAVPDKGIIGPRAIASTSLGDYFAWQDGIYRFNSDWPTKFSTKVEPVFRGQITENFPLVNSAYVQFVGLGYRNGRLWASFPPIPAGPPAWSLIFHEQSGRWFASSRGFRHFLCDGASFLGANGGGSGGIYSVEDSYGSGLTSFQFQGQYHDCGSPDREKTWGDLVITHNTQGAGLTITVRQNRDANPTNDSFTLATFSSSTLTKTILPLVYPGGYAVTALRGKPIRSFNLSVRITGAGAGSAPITIDSPILLHYYLEARRAKTYDTGLTSHGMPGVGLIDRIELDIDTSDGAATLVVSSDIPGGVLADRTSGGLAIAQTSGRQILRVVFATPIPGRLFRHQLSTTTTFQLYGFKVRALPIGVYADGSQNDFWYSEPLAPVTQ